MFNIISIGDSVFLTEVLKSLAMICATDDFMAMSKIAMLVGVLGVCISAVINAGKGVDFHHILVAYVIWACMFGPKVTVNIEDKYSGTVTVVANVPVGPAAAGTLISTMGEGLNSLFEVGYSPIIPGLSQSAFLDSLKLLNNTRRIGSMNTLMMAINKDSEQPNGVDIRLSWYNYIKDCTLKKISVGLMSHDELMSLPYETALKFNTPLYSTLVATNGAKQMGCDTAFDEINNNTKIGTETYKALASALALNSTNLKAGDTSEDALNNAVSVMLNASISAQQFVKLSLIESIMNSAVEGRYEDTLDTTSALAVNQAIQQRNSDWAASQGVFMTTVRPMMAFLEAFIYAITPIMAFVILLGSMGIKLAMKYFMLILWIQLWYPILSIINLYIYTVSRREILEHGGLSTFNWDSFYAVHTSTEIMSTWIATGGLLATTTPAIALFLVSGTAVAFTSLSGKLQGSDHVNEKQMTPDTFSPSAVMATQSNMTTNGATGSQARTGSAYDQLSTTTSSTNAATVSAVDSAAKASSTTFSENLSSTASSATSRASTQAISETLGKSIAATKSAEGMTQFNQAQSLMNSAGLSETEKDSVNAEVAGQIAAKGSIDFGAAIKAVASRSPIGAAVTKLADKIDSGDSKNKKDDNSPISAQATASVGGTLSSAQNTSSSQNTSTDTSQLRAVSLSSAQKSGFTNSTSAQLAASNTLTTAAAAGDTNAAGLIQNAQDAVTTSRAQTTTAARTQTSGSSLPVATKDLASAAATNPALQKAFRSAEARLNTHPESRDAIAEQTSFFQRNGGATFDQARNAAILQEMYNPHLPSGASPATVGNFVNDNNSDISNIVSAFSGSSPVNAGDATKNMDVVGAGSNYGSTEQKVKGGLNPVDRGVVGKGPGSDFSDENRQQVEGAQTKNDASLNNDHSSNVQKAADPESAKESIHRAASHSPGVAFTIGSFIDKAEQAGGTALAGYSGYANAVDQNNDAHVQAMTSGDPAQIKAMADKADSDRSNRADALYGGSGPIGTAAGLVVEGAATTGETITGAGAALVSNGMALLGNQDYQKYAEGMEGLTLQQTGQAILSGYSSAISSGAEAAQQYTGAVNTAMYERGMANGLTSAQAHVFADGFTGENKGNLAALRQEVNSSYSNPQEQEQVYTDLVKTLNNTASAGQDGQAEKFLAGVVTYNNQVDPGRAFR